MSARPRSPGLASEAHRLDSSLREELEQALERREDRLLKLRRRLHATPEASGEERETTKLVAEALVEHGYEPTVMAGEVGVIADLDLGASTDTTIALPVLTHALLGELRAPRRARRLMDRLPDAEKLLRSEFKRIFGGDDPPLYTGY